MSDTSNLYEEVGHNLANAKRRQQLAVAADDRALYEQATRDCEWWTARQCELGNKLREEQKL